RPPGHHAERRTFGGFCYLNNAAIAAERLSAHGKVAILDLDYHHGNGQQDIFFRRGDVLTVSIHGHPRFAYPFFCGFPEEVGEGEGEGQQGRHPLRGRVRSRRRAAQPRVGDGARHGSRSGASAPVRQAAAHVVAPEGVVGEREAVVEDVADLLRVRADPGAPGDRGQLPHEELAVVRQELTEPGRGHPGRGLVAHRLRRRPVHREGARLHEVQ
ncbi:MAG: hypothetical protein KC933_22590, partial [Myxococcales bacterium]|nr:hypothetical protein [Myxococcales bacterium]